MADSKGTAFDSNIVLILKASLNYIKINGSSCTISFHLVNKTKEQTVFLKLKTVSVIFYVKMQVYKYLSGIEKTTHHVHLNSLY